MLRLLIVLFCLTTSASAATLPWHPLSKFSGKTSVRDAFAEAHSTINAGSGGHGLKGPTKIDAATAVLIYLGVTGAISLVLPRSKRNSRRKSHAARAASAISRIRVTMARNPFDRWADRLLSSSKRASSAAASVASTSRTARPS